MYDSGKFNDVGFSGEHAPQILAAKYSLRMEVENHLKKMKIAESIDVNNIPDQDIFEFLIKTEYLERAINIRHTGCGISQILPIIVQSLIKNEESLIMIEQPEVHLNPKIQAELASFFVEIASKRHRFLIETHSDYIIERIRYHITKGDLKPEDVIIYYIDPDPIKKCSRTIEIEISSEGEYSNLPKGYLTNFRMEEINRQLDLTYEKMIDKLE